jgi:molybdopterin-guanine dinucleotide biosynthesis protein A
MGQNKALMQFHGIPLIQRIIDRMSSLNQEINVISNENSVYQFLNLPIFPDQIPGMGVLGGFYTAFLRSRQPYVAVIGCDLPFISAALLSAELEIIMESGVDVVIPESVNGLEPLHAVYRKSTCLPLVEKSLLHGDRRIITWFDLASVRVLNVQDIEQIDPNPNIFLNLNHPEDFINALDFEE